eukprot:494433_1
MAQQSQPNPKKRKLNPIELEDGIHPLDNDDEVSQSSIITLNVGGRRFMTLKSTLLNRKDTYFAKRFGGSLRLALLTVMVRILLTEMENILDSYLIIFGTTEPCYRTTRLRFAHYKMNVIIMHYLRGRSFN